MDNLQLRQLNPEAGSHPITSDPQQIEAARRAAERTHREITYFRERYAERGDRFALSDGAWLLGIIEFDWPYVLEQVLWLRTVLSSRGMPSWLLERHLRVLRGELPEHEDRYDPLVRAANDLADRRRAHLSDPEFERLGQRFDRLAPAEWCDRLPQMGWILASAVADQADEIDQAVNSLVEWCLDPDRFPERWLAAVRTIVEEATRQTA